MFPEFVVAVALAKDGNLAAVVSGQSVSGRVVGIETGLQNHALEDVGLCGVAHDPNGLPFEGVRCPIHDGAAGGEQASTADGEGNALAELGSQGPGEGNTASDFCFTCDNGANAVFDRRSAR